VDEHFAKSLGSAWTRIKTSLTQDTAAAAPQDCPPRHHASHQQSADLTSATDNPSASAGDAPGSVDDHFAKALGDTWFRIKAEHEALVANSDHS